MNISVVEDHPAITVLLTIILEKAGYQVTSYTSGASFLETLSSKEHPDFCELAIIDLHLPGGLSGREIIDAIGHTLCLELPIVVITAASQEEQERFHTSYPAIPILSKPFKMHMLLEVIQKITAKVNSSSSCQPLA